MSSSGSSSTGAARLFKIAAIISLIYFAQRVVVPIIFGWLFDALYSLHLIPGELSDGSIIASIGFMADILMAAPLIPIFMFIIAAAWFRFSDYPVVARGPVHLSMLVAFAATLLMTLAATIFATSVYGGLFGIFKTPVHWSGWLNALFSVSAIAIFISYTVLIYYLSQLKLVPPWVGALMVLGLSATGAILFSLPSLTPTTYDWPWTILSALGFGMSFALWKLGDAANQSMESQ